MWLERDAGSLDLHGSGIEAREIEQLVDEAPETVRLSPQRVA
jgi:hypothetical protein